MRVCRRVMEKKELVEERDGGLAIYLDNNVCDVSVLQGWTRLPNALSGFLKEGLASSWR